MTEQQLAERLHRDLGALATDAGWSTVTSTDQTYGNYTDPIADALALVGVALADATASQLLRIRQLALNACLDRLQLYYATLTDIKVGQREEKLSQIGAALIVVRAGLASSGASIAVGVTILKSGARDYTTADGDASTPGNVEDDA